MLLFIIPILDCANIVWRALYHLASHRFLPRRFLLSSNSSCYITFANIWFLHFVDVPFMLNAGTHTHTNTNDRKRDFLRVVIVNDEIKGVGLTVTMVMIIGISRLTWISMSFVWIRLLNRMAQINICISSKLSDISMVIIFFGRVVII